MTSKSDISLVQGAKTLAGLSSFIGVWYSYSEKKHHKVAEKNNRDKGTVRKKVRCFSIYDSRYISHKDV